MTGMSSWHTLRLREGRGAGLEPVGPIRKPIIRKPLILEPAHLTGRGRGPVEPLEGGDDGPRSFAATAWAVRGIQQGGAR